MTRMTPGQALELLPELAGAHIDSKISDGLTHNSFLVKRRDRAYVLRIDKPAAAELGLDRESEFAVHSAAANAGLAPIPLFISVETGVFVREFVGGRSWQAEDLKDPRKLQGLAARLNRLHALPAVGHPFDPLSAMQRYLSIAPSSNHSLLMEQSRTLLSQIGAMSPPAAPCHNDLLAQNIVQADSLLLIDWEYAGKGDPFFDLAVIIGHHGLSKQAAGWLISSYLGRDALPSEHHRLSLQQSVYRILLELWRAAIEEYARLTASD